MKAACCEAMGMGRGLRRAVQGAPLLLLMMPKFGCPLCWPLLAGVLGATGLSVGLLNGLSIGVGSIALLVLAIRCVLVPRKRLDSAVLGVSFAAALAYRLEGLGGALGLMAVAMGLVGTISFMRARRRARRHAGDVDDLNAVVATTEEKYKENTVNRMMLRNLIAIVTLSACWLQAHSQVRAFQQPPTLKEAPQPGAKSLLLMSVAPGTASACNPKANVSTDGNIVHVNLDIVRAHFTIFNPASGIDDPVELRSYGGCVTGPTIEVDPGTVLRVDLNNKLSVHDPTCSPTPPAYLHLYPGVGCFNNANLHTHGLHVSPAGNSDNVLLDIAPETTFPYEINIPYDHPAGTFLVPLAQAWIHGYAGCERRVRRADRARRA